MNSKHYLLSILFSVILNLCIFGILYFCKIAIPSWVVLLCLLLSIVLSLVFCFWLERENEKRFTQKLLNLIPDFNKEIYSKNKIGLDSLSQEIYALTQHKTTEIGLLKEQETYRREYLGNVSHELKTPLFSIQGYLLTLIEGGLEDENIRDKYLSRINKLVERLIYIVKDLDLISELESGNIEIKQRGFNIAALTQEIFDLLEMKAYNNSVTLEFDENYDEPVKVLGDIERIEQVLVNLINNAIKHSSRPTKVIVSFQEFENHIKTEITDFGIGIKQEQLPRIFERFYRVDRSRSRVMGGSGLGLSIVKHILDAHNQKIFVESEYGKKTVFHFNLEKSE